MFMLLSFFFIVRLTYNFLLHYLVALKYVRLFFIRARHYVHAPILRRKNQLLLRWASKSKLTVKRMSVFVFRIQDTIELGCYASILQSTKNRIRCDRKKIKEIVMHIWIVMHDVQKNGCCIGLGNCRILMVYVSPHY